MKKKGSPCVALCLSDHRQGQGLHCRLGVCVGGPATRKTAPYLQLHCRKKGTFSYTFEKGATDGAGRGQDQAEREEKTHEEGGENS